MRSAALIVVALLGCKEKATENPPIAVAAPPTSPTEKLSDAEFRTKNTLSSKAEAGKFAITDGAGLMKITLPKDPTFDHKMVSESGVSVFASQAVMPGGDANVDVQLGAMTSRDGDLPSALLDSLKNTPDQIVAMAGGKVEKNEETTISGKPARRYEIATADKRRMFGWMIHASAHARMYQINCVGGDVAKTRTDCDAIANSLALK